MWDAKKKTFSQALMLLTVFNFPHAFRLFVVHPILFSSMESFMSLFDANKVERDSSYTKAQNNGSHF